VRCQDPWGGVGQGRYGNNLITIIGYVNIHDINKCKELVKLTEVNEIMNDNSPYSLTGHTFRLATKQVAENQCTRNKTRTHGLSALLITGGRSSQRKAKELQTAG
jgi:hypothetical protein